MPWNGQAFLLSLGPHMTAQVRNRSKELVLNKQCYRAHHLLRLMLNYCL